MMRPLPKFAILVLGVATALGAIAGPDAFAPSELGSGVKVVVEVFSGRPNPAFTLDDPAFLQSLRKAFAGPAAETPDTSQVLAFSRLGYRGIVIENPAGLAGIPRHAQVLGGRVLVSDGIEGGPRWLQDAGLIEKRCLALAAERGLIADLVAAGLVPDPAAL